MTTFTAYLLVFVVMFIEPLNGFLTKHLVTEIGVSLTFVLWTLFGFLCSLLATLASRQGGQLITSFKKHSFDILCITLFACLSWACFFLALRHETVAVVTVIINSYIIFSLVISYFYFKERFTWIEWSGIVTTVFGVVVLTYQPFTQSLGVLFALANAFFYSIQYMFVKKIVHDIEPIVLSTLRLFGLTVFSLVIGIVNNVDFRHATNTTVLGLSFVGAAIGVLIGYIVYVVLRNISYGKLSILRLWQPAVLIFLSLLVFQEDVSTQELVGISIMLAGSSIIVMRGRLINWFSIRKTLPADAAI